MDETPYVRVSLDEMNLGLDEIVEDCKAQYQEPIGESPGQSQLEHDIEDHIDQAVDHLLQAHARFISAPQLYPDESYATQDALEIAATIQLGIKARQDSAIQEEEKRSSRTADPRHKGTGSTDLTKTALCWRIPTTVDRL